MPPKADIRLILVKRAANDPRRTFHQCQEWVKTGRLPVDRLDMSLKDEMEKMIQAERAKLEVRDQKENSFRDTQRDKFAPLKEVLREITSPVKRKYMDISISDDQATISMGYHSKDLRWVIDPNFEICAGVASDESLYESRPGFRLEVTHYSSGSKFSESLKFDSQQSLVNYLVAEIVERAAEYRHLDKKKRTAKD